MFRLRIKYELAVVVRKILVVRWRTSGNFAFLHLSTTQLAKSQRNLKCSSATEQMQRRGSEAQSII
jgi:hypothetical protein